MLRRWVQRCMLLFYIDDQPAPRQVLWISPPRHSHSRPGIAVRLGCQTACGRCLNERRRRQRRQPVRVSHTLALGRSCAQPHRVTIST